MCGIVGYIGKNNASEILYEGLKQLEYRGYDSVGIAVLDAAGRLKLCKKQGRVDSIKGDIEYLKGSVGIGHTRWATHGKPSDVNAHPHQSKRFAVVHNGIIENFGELKKTLSKSGYKFKSDTDTEVIACLINETYKGDFLAAVKDAIAMLQGSFAIAVLSEENPDKIVVARHSSPLVIGLGEGENYIASDSPALAAHTNKIYVLKDGELAVVKAEGVVLYDKDLSVIERAPSVVDVQANSLDKGNYEYFMLKEIKEIPQALRDTYSNFFYNQDLKPFKEKARRISHITIIGCGTAYHSGVVGKYVIEKLTRIPVSVEIASEYRYRNPIIYKDELVIAVTQSGETADTIAAARLAKESGALLAVVTNVFYSSITVFADYVFPTLARTEIGVAATKSYNCQVEMLIMLALVMAEAAGKNTSRYLDELQRVPDMCDELINKTVCYTELAKRFKDLHSMFFIGRQLDYAVALEGSLKLKEISYIHSEGYAAGELKHGTIALIDNNSLVVAIITDGDVSSKTLNAVHEVKARNATVYMVTCFEELADCDEADYAVLIPKTDTLFMPILSVIPLQCFAYNMAILKGNNPDKPRNLAKSVTVE